MPIRIDAMQRVAGLIATGIFLYMLHRTGSSEYTLETTTMVAAIVTIILIMYGPAGLVDVIDAWRGGDGDD